MTPAKAYAHRFSPQAATDLGETLPAAVAFAAHEFIVAVVVVNPYRVGTPLQTLPEGLLSARRDTYRVIYQVDDKSQMVTVERVIHRRDVYRS